MSSELEQRLEAMLADAPEPEAGAGEEALHRALRALQPVAGPRRGVRTAVLAFAAAVVLLVIAAGSLGAAGALHVSFGTKTKAEPLRTQLMLPRGDDGIGAVVDGRLSVVTRSGFRLQGLNVSAATLSPHALFVAAGIGHSLVAMAPNRRQAWSHSAGGKVVAIAWAPDAIRIAYLVKSGHRLALHLIWGTGTNDRTIDTSTRAVLPSWRSDSLALAYVGAGGRAVVYDLKHRRHRVDPASPADVTQVAFAPSGTKLAMLGAGSVVVGKKHVSEPFSPVGLGWLGRRLTLVGRNGFGPVHVFSPFVSAQSNGRTFAIVAAGGGTRVLAGSFRHLTTVLSLPPASRVQEVVVR